VSPITDRLIGADPTLAAVTQLVSGWAPDAPPLRGRARVRARRAILSAAAALGAADATSRLPFAPRTATYQVAVIGAAFDAAARDLAGVEPAGRPVRTIVPRAAEPPLPMLTPAHRLPALSANEASAGDLAQLPGLGPTSARRIVAARQAHGPFTDLDGVRRAARISARAFDQARPLLVIAQPDRQVSPRVLSHVATGGLAALYRAALTGEVSVVETAADGDQEALLRLIEVCAERIVARPHRDPLWGPSRERLARGSAALRADARFSDRAARDGVQAALLRSNDYLPLLLHLIDHAQTSIHGLVYFFHLAADRDPGVQVVEALGRARARGVDVKLMLSHDLPGDYHRARLVNQGAFARLRAARVPVRMTHVEVPSHAKVITIDGQHVLIGSHNWTASSFYRYEETSAYLHSAAAAAQAEGRLDRLWRWLATGTRRVVPVADLESIPADLRGSLASAGIASGTAFMARTARAGDRRALADQCGVSAAALAALRPLVALLQAFPIAERTAAALVAAGLDSPARVRRASSAALDAALSPRRALPAPFEARSLPAGLSAYLRSEVLDG
jgi:hypothetical protein